MALNLKPDTVIISELGIQQNGPIHLYFTKRCADYMDKYVPYDEGDLSRYKIPQPDTILYEQHYAEYQWRGERIDGTYKINEANRNRSMHPDATSHWEEKMWTLHKDDILKEVAEEMKKRGA